MVLTIMNNQLIDVVIPAAGVGKRMGANIPKQYLKIDNLTILERTINKFIDLSFINNIIVVLDKNDVWFNEININSKKIIRVDGGKERANSVLNGLKKATTDFVLIHDAARPLVDKSDIINLINQCSDENGGILALRVSDTIKRSDNSMNILKTEPRDNLYRALTPQYFKTNLIISAYENAFENDLVLTDEASAMELFGYSPKLVLGSPLNIKITEQQDLIFANLVISNRINS